MILLKSSFYNLFFPIDTENFLLFNTLRSSLLRVDKEVKEVLENELFDKLPGDFVRIFKDNGILIEDNFDEKEVFRYLFERGKHLSPTAGFHVITTYACNLACTYCFEGMGNLTADYMDLTGAENVIKFIKKTTIGNNCNALSIELYGGEPLLNFDIGYTILVELSDWAKENGIHFSVNAITNGTLITEDIANKLSEFKSSILVTLDGPKEIHNRRRMYKGGRGTFDDIVKGLIIAKEHKLPTKVRINFDNENQSYIPTLFDELRSLSLEDVVISIKPIFNSSPACLSYPSSFQDSVGITISDRLYEIARDKGFKTEEVPVLPTINVCSALHSSVFTVDPPGRLFKCAVLPPYEEFSVGEIDEKGEPRFNSLFYEMMRREPLTIDDCGSCKLVPICGSGCLAIALGRYKTPNKKVCMREAMMERLSKQCKYEWHKKNAHKLHQEPVLDTHLTNTHSEI